MDEDFTKLENRLDSVERQGVELTHRLQSVETTQLHHSQKMDSMANKLDQIVNAVTRSEALPKVDLVKVLMVTKDLAILTGLVATLLGFVINSYGAPDRAVLSWRINQLERYAEHTVIVPKGDKQP